MEISSMDQVDWLDYIWSKAIFPGIKAADMDKHDSDKKKRRRRGWGRLTEYDSWENNLVCLLSICIHSFIPIILYKWNLYDACQLNKP